MGKIDLGSPEWLAAVERALLADNPLLEAKSPPSEPRERLIAMIAMLKQGDWCAGEDFVAALELFPQNTAQCPCCDKQVQLCTKHYQLHEPGKLCSGCRRGE